MIGRATDNWDQYDTVANYITERLPNVLKAGNSVNKDEVSTLEEPQAEPFADYFSYEYRAGIVMDGNWNINPMHKSGFILVGLLSSKPCIQGAAFEVWNESGKIIVDSENNLREAFSSNTILARWIRLANPPKMSSPPDLFNHLSQQDNPNKISTYPVDGGKIQIRAALFPDERGHREVGQGWIFVCRYDRHRPIQKKPIKSKNKTWR